MADYWPQIITGLSGLLGSIIGATASYLAQTRSRNADIAARRRSLAFALGAEIKSFLEITERRGKIRMAEHMARQARSGMDVQLRGFLAEEERNQGQFPIYTANLSSIGSLGPITKELVLFYGMVNAVYLTIKRAEIGDYDTYTPAEKADLIEGEITIWRAAIDSGKKLSETLLAF
ncbi:hypothetical protein [Sinorhizobium americanum]|nr:hypothetical protein [Sinorhizobium americanum]